MVLLSVSENVARALEAAFVASSVPARLVRCTTAAEVVERAQAEPPAVVVLHASNSPELLRHVIRLRRIDRGDDLAPINVVVVFEDAGDRRRAAVAAAGAEDFIEVPQRDDDDEGECLAPLASKLRRLFEQEAIEQRLAASRGRFRALVENSNDAIYILQNHTIAYVNPRFVELVNIPEPELLGDAFDLDETLIAEESRAYIDERARRVDAGEPVESRYEFVCKRRGAENFDAQVSISYIDFQGQPASLGILQDITERKRFEKRLIQMNRELGLLNELATSVNEAVHLDETLAISVQRVRELLLVPAVGITLLSRDGRNLELHTHEGISDSVVQAIRSVPTQSDTLLAHTVRTGEIQVVEDIATDGRIGIDSVRDARFTGCTVVPVRAKGRILGAAFVFTQEGAVPSESDRDLMRSIGVLLGTAIDKASLLDQESAMVERLKTLDEIALTVVSTLDLQEVAKRLAERVQSSYGPRRVLLCRYSKNKDAFVPLAAVDDDASVEIDLLPRNETLMGVALDRGAPVIGVPEQSKDAARLNPSPLPAGTKRLFDEGFATVLAVPVIQQGTPVGGILLGFDHDPHLDEGVLDALMSLSTHVAIAMQNAAFFAARNHALEDLKAAQDKLVQSEKLNALGELAAGVAHDFNNVLGAIMGRAQLLLSSLEDPQQRKHAEIIEKAATDGAETVRRIQEIGRQDSTDDFVSVDVGEIVDDVVELTRPKWFDRPRSEGRIFDVTTQRLVPEGTLVHGNPHELREVLINLVHNAVDAMPDGGSISLISRLSEDTEGFCEIVVSDTGAGIPDEVRQRIFDPFFTTKGSLGTGLGLSVSYSIIKRHGGDILLESRTQSGAEGQSTGTTFTLCLPLDTPAAAMANGQSDDLESYLSTIPGPALEPAPADAFIAAGEVAAAPALTPTLAPTVSLSEPSPAMEAARAVDRPALADAPEEGALVLVIDDEENIREILTDILATGGHRVITAATGPEGISLLDQHAFDLVLTDLGLPGMTGYEVAEAVKERRPSLSVGLVTGWGATLDENKVRSHGVDLVLSKPFRFDQVLAVVDRALSERPAATPNVLGSI